MNELLTEKEQVVHSVPAQLAIQQGEIELLSTRIAEQDQTISSLSARVAEQDQTIASLSIQLGGKERLVQSLASQVIEKDQLLRSISRSTGWAFLQRLWYVKRLIAPSQSQRERIMRFALKKTARLV